MRVVAFLASSKMNLKESLVWALGRYLSKRLGRGAKMKILR